MLSLIAALGANRAIGRQGQLLWHLPEDLRHFRETTRGAPVIMGRKTWESLPTAFRPLPGRQNIVVSRNADYAAPGALVVASLDDALARTADAIETFIIGGGELYRAALPRADRLYLTEVEERPEADVFFPEIDKRHWREIERRAGSGTAGGPKYDFAIYARRAGEA